MAKNWNAYEAAKVLLESTNKEEITEIITRFPLFSRTILLINDDLVLDVLGAIPKTTARVVESGIKEGKSNIEGSDDDLTEVATKEMKEAVKEPETEADYESMTATNLYKLCCERGLSGKCKSRKKEALIAVLRGEAEPEPTVLEKEETTDDWVEDEKPKSPYAGKKAKELYELCKERGIKVKPRLTADVYVKELEKADSKPAPEPEPEDDDDEWEI